MKAGNVVQHVGQEILDLLAGHRPSDAFSALATALASVAGGGCQDRGIEKDTAHKIIDAVAWDAHGMVDRYWGKFEVVKNH